MTISEKLVKEIQFRNRLDTPELDEFEKFHERMLKLGIIEKQSYSLPQIDTTGIRFYQRFRIL